MHVACVHIIESLFEGDVSGAGQSLVRGGRYVHHAVTGVECGEVQRHVRTQVLAYPCTFSMQLGVVIVESRDE